MELGVKITLARKKMGHTQESLAEAANLSLSTIQRIEKGKVIPRTHSINVLSSVLNLDLKENYFSNNHSKIVSTKLFWITFFSLILVFIPLLNIIISLKFWSKDKNHQTIDFFVKKIVLFQSIWFVIFIISLLLIPIISYMLTGQSVNGKSSASFLAYILFLIANITTILIFYLKTIKNHF